MKNIYISKHLHTGKYYANLESVPIVYELKLVATKKTKDSSGNYSKLEKENRICKLCNLRLVEDEFHFLLKCPLYSDIRHNFIDNIQRNCDNFHHLSEKN